MKLKLFMLWLFYITELLFILLGKKSFKEGKKQSLTANNNLKKDLLILVRHGERVDKIGLIPKLHKDDPEITEKGQQQGFQIGNILADLFVKNYSHFKKIYIISSPFARTIQTSKKVMEGINRYVNNLNYNVEQEIPNISLENKIYLSYDFSEYIDQGFSSYDISRFLTVKNQIESLKSFLSDTKLIFLNSQSEVTNDEYENINHVSKRMLKGIEAILRNKRKIFNINKTSNAAANNEDNENNVFIIVSHAEPINQLNIVLDYPGKYGWENIKYANAIIYDIIYDKRVDKPNNYSLHYVNSLFPKL